MKRKDERYWEIRERKIIVILFEETKEFFINDTTQQSLWKYYDEHFRERITKTRSLFAQYKQKKQLPPMFHICTVNGTSATSFARRMEVAKYFIDHGYTSIIKGELLASIEEFTDWDKSEFYLSIKDIPVEIMCAPEKNLFPEFKSSSKNQRTEHSKLPPDVHRIRLTVTREEHERLKNLAKKHGIPMSEYILECARNGGIIRIDTNFMERHARKMDDCYENLKGILVAFLLSQNYFPSDIVKLEKIKNEMAKINNEASADMKRYWRNFSRHKKVKKEPADLS